MAEALTTTAAAEVKEEYPPFLRIYADGRIERLFATATVPPSTDPVTGVACADAILHPNTGLSARLFLPPPPYPEEKLPVLLYFHGGGFCVGSAFGPVTTPFLAALSGRARSLVVSVGYRLAPEHPLPAAYDDAFDALSLVAASGVAVHPWLAAHGDSSRLYLAGDSAGANIAHRTAMRAGGAGIGLSGLVLCHPFFWGSEALPGEAKGGAGVERNWRMVCPGTSGCDDPWLNPRAEGARAVGEGLAGCARALVCVAEKDMFRWRGEDYYELLAAGGLWAGVAELFLSEGEGHAFHLLGGASDRVVELIDRIASFLNR